MAVVIPAIVGIASLASGFLGGWLIFRENEHDINNEINKENGVINNLVKVEEKEQTGNIDVWTIRTMLVIQVVIMLVLVYKECSKKRRSTRSNNYPSTSSV